MDKIKIQDLKIGQQVKFYFGSGEIVRLSDPAYQMRDCGDDYCISLKCEGAYYNCTIEEIQECNNQ